MAGGGGQEAESINLEFTPTWVVAVVCTLIVFISLAVERLLHFAGTFLKRKNQKPLYEALLKIKEELMLLGFISLLLVVFQNRIQHFCVDRSVMNHMLPCAKEQKNAGASPTEHYLVGEGRRRLAGGASGSQYCARKGKVPLLSLEAIHQLHIFIFVLAVTHVTFCVTTIILGTLKIQQWKQWEDQIQEEQAQPGSSQVTLVRQLEFIRERYKGIGKDSMLIRWIHSFGKQFYGSVTKSDYKTMRLGFIMTHCPSNLKFNFYKYMMRALEADFKKVVGISWYLWIFVVVFLLLNVNGWHAYFWISFIPLILLLALGTKLEHVITKLAHDVAEKHVVIEGDLVVKPSDDHFWFRRPKIVIHLIHFILFENAFEIAFFFWIWSTYGFDSCIMGHVRFIVPRLVIGAIIQVLCSYSTLPLYAIVTQMGSSFKKAIFDDHIQQGLAGWASKVRNRKGGLKLANGQKKSDADGSTIPLESMTGNRDIEEGNSAQDGPRGNAP